MPRLWQYQARDLPLSALPQPAAAGAGFEAVAPDRPVKRRTDPGSLDTPVAPAGAATIVVLDPPGVAPSRRASAPSFTDLPLLALPQPTPPNGGFDSVAPAKSVTGRTAQPGGYADTYTALPQPTPPNGWEAFAPEKGPRGRGAGGSWRDAENLPPAATANFPQGWQAEADAKARRAPRPDGNIVEAFAPPPVSPLAPWAWQPKGPDRAVSGRAAPPGAVQEIFRALDQPTPPNGWPANFDDRGTRGRAAPDWIDFPARFIPPPPPTPSAPPPASQGGAGFGGGGPSSRQRVTTYRAPDDFSRYRHDGTVRLAAPRVLAKSRLYRAPGTHRSAGTVRLPVPTVAPAGAMAPALLLARSSGTTLLPDLEITHTSRRDFSAEAWVAAQEKRARRKRMLAAIDPELAALMGD